MFSYSLNITTNQDIGTVLFDANNVALGIIQAKSDTNVLLTVFGNCYVKLNFICEEATPQPIYYDSSDGQFKLFTSPDQSNNKVIGFLMGCLVDAEGNHIHLNEDGLHQMYLIGL